MKESNRSKLKSDIYITIHYLLTLHLGNFENDYLTANQIFALNEEQQTLHLFSEFTLNQNLYLNQTSLLFALIRLMSSLIA